MKETRETASGNTPLHLMAKLESDPMSMTVEDICRLAFVIGGVNFNINVGGYEIDFAVERKEPRE